MNHLKTFESFSKINEEEEIIGLLKKGPIQRAVSKFKEDNEEDFLALKEAEKKGGGELKDIQLKLNKKLLEFKRGEMRQILSNTSDLSTANRELSDIINNIKADDTRSTFQKLGSGSSGGFFGDKKK